MNIYKNRYVWIRCKISQQSNTWVCFSNQWFEVKLLIDLEFFTELGNFLKKLAVAYENDLIPDLELILFKCMSLRPLVLHICISELRENIFSKKDGQKPFKQRKTWRHMWKVHVSVSGNHPSSLKSCSELTYLSLRLRIIQAPRFSNLSSLSKYVLSELDHTVSQYSYKGWTTELCSCLHMSMLINFLILPKSRSLRDALEATVSMCSCQFKLESKLTPRYLWKRVGR